MPKEGKHYRFDELEFWAEDGLIFIQDHRDGSVKADTRADFVKRARAVNNEAEREYKRGKYPDEHKRLVDCVINMRDAWNEAKDQGDPADPEIAIQKYREYRRSQGAVLIKGMEDLPATLPTRKLFMSGF